LRPIRVVSIGLSRFRADVVRRALTRPDIVVVDGIDESSLIAGTESIDVAVVGTEGNRLPAICGILLYATPRIKMLVIEEQGGETTLYELQPRKVRLGNVTEDELAAAVRGDALARS
jgi:hypothetical protein